ncbi:PREDICTED: uncharacterized protein LOC109229758 [Nicotiana attenuata]|uniref:uncharacterized protein LOC109229758 n=1 Tax=Nicotiana attenuata TaxID=49451 RepID=UPI0009055B75|nr:PREDICTED: uncharacterized protein LOC109229758 [Nicotiana attenuata]
MAEEESSTTAAPPCEFQTRPAGSTEHSWCKAVPGGTGITVLALLLSKSPDISLLQNALHKLQNSNPILKSKLHYEPTTNSYSYIIPSTSHLQIQPFDISSTAQILQQLKIPNHTSISDFHLILEHELNKNSWVNTATSSDHSDTDVLFPSIYRLSDEKWAVTLRIHTSTCDRPAALALLRKLLELMSSEKGKGMNENEGGRVELELRENMEVGLGIEEYIPAGKANKPFWARGIDMVGYGLNALRFANLNFIDSESTRGSQVVKLQLNKEDTDRILDGCKTRGIKLCGVLAAAGLIAAHCSKGLPEDQWEKYAVVTLINCRSILDPVLSPDFPGFYHSAILNTHDVKGGEDIWELAKRSYTSFINAKNNNKHFSDMGDLNFLMCKAIDNPGLTPASSLRTSLISVFEDPVIDNSSTVHQEIGLEDFIGCASVHGVGPSIAIFDTIRDGQLDCACVYPFPLHTREQIQELIGEMKRILVDW